MTPHDFKTKLAEAEKWEAVLDARLRDSGYEVRPLGPYEPDREVTLPSGFRLKVEYKCDERALETRNAFIETISNSVTGRPGWAMTTEADWVLYFVVPKRVLGLRPARIRGELELWKQYRKAKADNGTYQTIGLLVPLSVVLTAADFVSELDRGDGIYLVEAS